MNLHDIKFALTNVAIWLHAQGRNGRDIGVGDHLWVLPEGEPPTEQQTRPRHTAVNWWTPTRLSWQPFAYQHLFRRGWVPPLCGQRTASQAPRIGLDWGGDYHCQPCLTAASRAGIVALTYNHAREQSSVYSAIQAEMAEFSAAGRPSPWPPSPSDTPTS